MLSQKARYALRALLALARLEPGRTMMIGDIAEGERVPRKFLELILLDLKHHGVLLSKRGKKGGYALLQTPEEITFGQIVRILDGPMAPLPCLSRTAYRRCDDCVSEEGCLVRGVFAQAYAAQLAILDSTTLADALASVPAQASAGPAVLQPS